MFKSRFIILNTSLSLANRLVKKQIHTKASQAINVKHNKHFATGLLDYGTRIDQTCSATTTGNRKPAWLPTQLLIFITKYISLMITHDNSKDQSHNLKLDFNDILRVKPKMITVFPFKGIFTFQLMVILHNGCVLM